MKEHLSSAFSDRSGVRIVDDYGSVPCRHTMSVGEYIVGIPVAFTTPDGRGGWGPNGRDGWVFLKPPHPGFHGVRAEFVLWDPTKPPGACPIIARYKSSELAENAKKLYAGPGLPTVIAL